MAESQPVPAKSQTKRDKPLYCSFCGYDQYERKKMIAGPGVFICDQCVATCVEIIAGSDEVSPDDVDVTG